MLADLAEGCPPAGLLPRPYSALASSPQPPVFLRSAPLHTGKARHRPVRQWPRVTSNKC